MNFFNKTDIQPIQSWKSNRQQNWSAYRKINLAILSCKSKAGSWKNSVNSGNWWPKNVVLRGIDGAWRHKLPHGCSWISNHRYQLAPNNLIWRRKCSRNCRSARQETWLSIEGFHFLFKVVFCFFQAMFLIS